MPPGAIKKHFQIYLSLGSRQFNRGMNGVGRESSSAEFNVARNTTGSGNYGYNYFRVPKYVKQVNLDHSIDKSLVEIYYKNIYINIFLQQRNTYV